MRIYSQDTRMKFSIENCTTQLTRSGKLHITEEIEKLNQEKIRMLGEKETYKFLEILEADTLKLAKIIEKN